MDVAVFEVECDHALALSVLHDQVQREVLDEVVGIVVQRLNRTLDPCFKQITVTQTSDLIENELRN